MLRRPWAHWASARAVNGRLEDPSGQSPAQRIVGTGVRLLTGRSGAWLFTAALTTTAAAVFVLLIVPASAVVEVQGPPWVAFALAFGLAEVAVVHMMIRNQAVTVSLSEIPLVVGFYALGPAWLVVAQLAGSAVALLVHRHQPPLKLIFNLALFSLSSSLAIVVFRAVGPVAGETLRASWLASFAGTATVVAVSALAISIVISISQRRLEISALRRGLLFGLLTGFVNTSIALVGVVFLRSEPDDIWLLGVPALIGLLGYRSFSAQRQRQARLEFLYQCTEVLNEPMPDEEALGRLLRLTREMFRARMVEVLLEDADGGPRFTSMVVQAGAEPETGEVSPSFAFGRRSLLGPNDSAALVANGAAPAGGPGAGIVREAMVAPLRASSELVGTLMVAGRLDDLGSFDGEDLRVLETLGSRLGLVAHNSGLLRRLAASLADITQLAEIVESSEDAILAVAVTGEITAWNPAATRLLGHATADVVGRLAADVIPDHGRPGFREMLEAALRGAVVRNVHAELAGADGTALPVSVTISPIRGPAGDVAGASAIVRDESDRVRADKAEAAGAEQLRTVVAGSPLGMGVAGPDHRWTQANPALCAMLGRSTEQTLGRLVTELVHPDDRVTVSWLEERIFDDEPAVRSVERRYVGPDGRLVWASVTARLLRVPSSETPVALYMIEDITKRRQAEEQTRTMEERFRRAALAISAARDPAMVIQATLGAAREMLRAEYATVAMLDEADADHEVVLVDADGVEPGEVLGRFGRWPSSTGPDRLDPRLERAVRLRNPEPSPAPGERPDDRASVTSLLGVPIAHDGPGRAALYLANKLDADEFNEGDEAITVALATHAGVCLENARISARERGLVDELDRANLELMKANEAKSQFLANVAHELRTPLHAILVAGEMVHDAPGGPLPPSQVRDMGETIASGGRHMVRLIDDLVDLARIEAGKLDLQPTQVVIGEILAEVATSVAGTAAERGISLELPDGPGPALVADPLRLRQILTNLVANALKFTERGGRVWVDFGAARGATSITVRDTGIGIAPGDIERAFMPFERVSKTSTPGAGLGLAISRRLAELHGGTLDVTSTLGVGSAFTITLPHRAPGKVRAPRDASEKPLAIGAGKGRTVLVVEDNVTARNLATEVLRLAGYEVWQASGLAEANERLDRTTPALILLDIRLGDGSGLDLIRRVRADETRSRLPILVLSADAMPDDVQRARAFGCTDFLAKPVSPRALLARVHTMLEEKAAAV